VGEGVGGYSRARGGLITSFNISFTHSEGVGGYSRARGGLITSFNTYISHVKVFTSKINEEGVGHRNLFFGFLSFVI
jgi:hypothetical protein